METQTSTTPQQPVQSQIPQKSSQPVQQQPAQTINQKNQNLVQQQPSTPDAMPKSGINIFKKWWFWVIIAIAILGGAYFLIF